MYRYVLVFVITCLLGGSLYAQSEKMGFGFRAGASYAKIDGPSETGPDGENLESFSNKNGFHIGAAFSYKFTDLIGLRAELVFSQRGSILDYNGPSYYIVGRDNELITTITGTRNQSLKVNNTYFDLPVMVYYKFGVLEISGGAYTSILMSSTGGGSTNFDGRSSIGTNVLPFSVGMDNNYKSDKAKEASAETFNVNVDGFPYAVPTRIGAYYEFESRDKNQYKTFDFGLVACASFYINSGLYVSARYNYGLTDVDRNEYDVSLQNLSPGSTLEDPITIPRADDNKSRSWQFSVGFSF